MAGFLGSHAQVVQVGLLRSHVAAVTVEGTHGGLGTAVQGGRGGGPRACCRRSGLVGDLNASLLGRGQLLDETVG